MMKQLVTRGLAPVKTTWPRSRILDVYRRHLKQKRLDFAASHLELVFIFLNVSHSDVEGLVAHEALRCVALFSDVGYQLNLLWRNGCRWFCHLFRQRGSAQFCLPLEEILYLDEAGIFFGLRRSSNSGTGSRASGCPLVYLSDSIFSEHHYFINIIHHF